MLTPIQSQIRYSAGVQHRCTWHGNNSQLCTGESNHWEDGTAQNLSKVCSAGREQLRNIYRNDYYDSSKRYCTTCVTNHTKDESPFHIIDKEGRDGIEGNLVTCNACRYIRHLNWSRSQRSTPKSYEAWSRDNIKMGAT